jgi:hypothetical protein
MGNGVRPLHAIRLRRTATRETQARRPVRRTLSPAKIHRCITIVDNDVMPTRDRDRLQRFICYQSNGGAVSMVEERTG